MPASTNIWNNSMKKMSLVQLVPQHKARVIEIMGAGNLHQRLMERGLYIGKEVVKVSHIGLRGPVVIKTGRTILALGHGVAEKIIVELV